MKKNLSIIGVIILAIIVIIIALITYSYVESIRKKPDSEITDFIKGIVIDIRKNNSIKYNNEMYPIFDVVIQNERNEINELKMFFYNLYPPMQENEYRFFYEPIIKNTTSIYRIVRVEMI